jgi:transglutaminase-like putative cysteine protease
MRRPLWLLTFVFALFTSISIAQTAPDRAKPAAGSPFKDLIASAGETGNWDDASVVLVFDSTWVDVDTTGLSHKRMHVLKKILTPKGIAETRAERFDYDPASNKIEITQARIHRKDGTVEAIDLSTVRDLPQPTHLIYWGARMKVLPVPPLEVGDALETEYTLVGFMIAYLASNGEEEKYIPPMRGTYYDVITFGSDVLEGPTPPIKTKCYTVSMPESKPAQYETYNGTVRAATLFGVGRTIYQFSKDTIPAYAPENRAPDAPDVVTKVVFTNVKSWAEKSRWFYKVNEDAHVFDSDDAIKAEVAKITSGCKTDTCKFYALLHWVAQGIRYSGVSMGKGEGFTLHPGIMSFRDRAGVCKDIAGMLVTMLRAAGYTTYPVMTKAGAKVERIPADQFNHCVVAVKRPDGSFLMLDPTWSPFNTELWSRAESNQDIVPGTPEGDTLRQITKFTPEQNDFAVTVSSKLDGEGNLSGSVHIQGLAQGDARIRRPFSDAGQDQWDGIVRAWLYKANPAAELTRITYGNLWDFYKAFAVDFEFRVPDYARITGKRLDYTPFSQRLVWAGGYQMNILSGLDKDKRTQPIFTYNPRQTTIKETLQLPPGYTVRKLPDDRKVGGSAAWTKGGWKKTGGALEFSEVWHVQERWLPASDYSEVKKATDALKDHDGVAVILNREGGK